ncbi:SDR family oxidoreductase [Ferruginibacter sp. HRS2-29]|uniref:SDR family oxidoreductase n=1 Tax=Ferruginibacter sp. HRS2-29 TaxID=2487334 RepID=UPI0020CC21B2|nr:SDR family oxidoreductase [Ferruginibacter sp. HRS2-29]MCP9751215.1 SDR family oxidoreductase [Ferruginibacter sp. HRS2-29]
MKILITGANGYIGQRLIPVLLEEGHELYCCVRNSQRFVSDTIHANMHVIETDFLQPGDTTFPEDIDVAYYLIHSMSSGKDFEKLEAESAVNFIRLLEKTSCKQLIYLTGIVNEQHLSQHLSSRLAVENILNKSTVPLTALRAGIIVGSGSASFEIIRDLVEKLPVMVTPKWLNTLCQPIAIRNVIQFLNRVRLKENTFGKNFDIGGPDVLSYKNMLLQFAEVRKLKRKIFILPIMTPRLSSYWLYFVTSTSYSLAVNLVDSMKINVVCRPNDLAAELNISLISYKEAVEIAFEKIEQQMVLSSWKDAFISSNSHIDLAKYVEVPLHGVFKDVKWREVGETQDQVMSNVWSIGGEKGWYYANSLWKVRGLMDKFVGGVGLRRGRTNTSEIQAGDALDFWRVLVADKKRKRLLLFAEMKLPGEAWLEFRILKKNHKLQLRQTATFRPKGLWGRLYWMAMLPFHYFIFSGMIRNICKVD